MKQVLLDGATESKLSKRASARLDELRAQFDFLSEGGTTLVQGSGGTTWWTFAGGAANAVLSAAISQLSNSPPTRTDDLCLRLSPDVQIDRGGA